MRRTAFMMSCAAVVMVLTALTGCGDVLQNPSQDGVLARAADSLDIWFGERLFDHEPNWLRYGGETGVTVEFITVGYYKLAKVTCEDRLDGWYSFVPGEYQNHDLWMPVLSEVEVHLRSSDESMVARAVAFVEENNHFVAQDRSNNGLYLIIDIAPQVGTVPRPDGCFLSISNDVPLDEILNTYRSEGDIFTSVRLRRNLGGLYLD